MNLQKLLLEDSIFTTIRPNVSKILYNGIPVGDTVFAKSMLKVCKPQ